MPIVAGDWTVTRSTKVISYTGSDHNTGSPSYATVIEFHRWLQGLADDALATGDDELDITNVDPSRRSTDNIITLINGYTIGDTEAEHLYDGSIIQNDGDDIYDGIVNFGNSDVQIQIIQNGAVLADDWWNHRDEVYGDGGLNYDDNNGVSHKFMIKTRSGGSDIDGRRLIGITRTYGNTFGEFKINGTARGNNVLALNDGTDLNNATSIGTIAAIADIYIDRTASTATVSGVNSTGQAVLNTSDGTQFTAGDFIMKAGDDDEYQIVSIATNALTLNHNLAVATTGGEAIYDLNIGYRQIDVDNSGTPESYYSEWDTGSNTINEFYERLKWLSRAGTLEYVYGLSGELFRGITHQITVDGPTGTFAPVELVTWSTGTGQMLAINSPTAATIMWIQLLTGVAPTNDQVITGDISGATATVNVTVTDRSSLISTPFVGASTGSAIIGSYGLGIQTEDLTSADSVFELINNTQITPPNNVTNTLTGLVSGEDRVLVAPWDGSTTDTNGDPAITKDQLTLNFSSNPLTAVNETSVVVVEAIPSDTPASGTIRVTSDTGFETRVTYTSWTGSTFTIPSTDFSGADAQATGANDVYITYIDKLADATTAAFTSIQNSTRNLVVLVRDGGASPIKQYIAPWSQTSSSTSASVIRTTDT